VSATDSLPHEKAKLVAERDWLQSLYEHVHHFLRKANDRRFGVRNERLDHLPADQLQLALRDIEPPIACRSSDGRSIPAESIRCEPEKQRWRVWLAIRAS
jgi:hypothetical protein